MRKTLNIDPDKLRRVKKHLGLATDTEVIDRLLDDADWERELAETLATASPSWKRFRTPLARSRGRT
jgi:hypothetical protein